MAAKKSKQYPYKWPNGEYHSVPWEQTKQYAAQQAAARQSAAQQAVAQHEAAKPAAPAAVSPFLTADDMDAINSFNTDLQTKLQGIDFDLSNLEADTNFQKTQSNKSAKESSAQATDSMIGRGLFRSSIKDAALYDIEAQRALSQKFLDDKLTSARLNAGTQKQILARSKTAFDESIAAHKTANAQAINDQAAAAWSQAMAQWGASAPAPAPASTPKTTAAPVKGAGKAQKPITVTRPTVRPNPDNRSKTKNGKVKDVYGAR